MPSNRVAGFLPSTCGFAFTNSFEHGTPVVEVPTPFGNLGIGNAGGGVCGGMVFAILDFFHTKQPPPSEPSTVFRYLCQRLMDSFNLPFGVLKYYDWQSRPSASQFLGGVRIRTGVRSMTIEEEWPRIRAAIDAGQLAPLGLVKAHSISPIQLKKNHQVLAYGYDFDEVKGDLNIPIYDPNYPGDDTASLRFNIHNPHEAGDIRHTCGDDIIRGIFLTEYRLPLSVPEFGTVEEAEARSPGTVDPAQPRPHHV